MTTYTFKENDMTLIPAKVPIPVGNSGAKKTTQKLPSCNCCNCLFREASLSWYIL